MDALSVDLAIQQALAQSDVRGAARLLVLHHADAVYATCRAMVRDAHLSEDLSQEAFTKALAALPRFRGESQSRTWLLSITRNVCIDHLRRTKGPIDERVPLDVEVEVSDAPPAFELLARRGDVERALTPLTEIERAIVVLHHVHGVGYPELASSFGIAEGALRMRMSRALSKMREALSAPMPSLGAPMAAPVPHAPSAAPMPAAPPAARAPAPARAAVLPDTAAGAARAAAPDPEGEPSAAPAKRARASFGERLRALFGGAPETPAPVAATSPAPLWPMPATVRERLLARIG